MVNHKILLMALGDGIFHPTNSKREIMQRPVTPEILVRVTNMPEDQLISILKSYAAKKVKRSEAQLATSTTQTDALTQTVQLLTSVLAG